MEENKNDRENFPSQSMKEEVNSTMINMKDQDFYYLVKGGEEENSKMYYIGIGTLLPNISDPNTPSSDEFINSITQFANDHHNSKFVCFSSPEEIKKQRIDELFEQVFLKFYLTK